MDEIGLGWKTGVGIVILTWLFIDFFVLINNIFSQTGLGGCKIDWTNIGPFTRIFEPDKTCDTDPGLDTSDDKKCTQPLGIYNDFAKQDFSKKAQCLCPGEVHSVVEDTLSNNKLGGYNFTQLLAYVIVPFMTTIGIIYALIFTRPSYAEWIFWIIIATIIYTGLTSISYTSEIPILPEQRAPLSYITDKLNMSGADELKYSFMARKDDGSECFVEGIMLGGGAHPENQPPTYSGECNASTLPMY